MTDQSKDSTITWRDGSVPIATRFDDPYYSLTDGAAESRFVFIDGNALQDRLKSGFHVAELGFGTGLNLCVLLTAWRAMGAPGQIRFTSFEAFPISMGVAERALAGFPSIAASAETVLSGFRDTGFHLETPEILATVIEGDAREALPRWNESADAWFLDGFSPAKNPELWEANLMRAVFDKTAPMGTLATYTAAGHVRRSLQDAGFDVSRVPGFAHKRHMTIGQKS